MVCGIWIIMVLIGAGILALVILAMEPERESPNWLAIGFCVFASRVPGVLLAIHLPDTPYAVAVLANAAATMLAIRLTCGMGMARAALATVLYLVLEFVAALIVAALL